MEAREPGDARRLMEDSQSSDSSEPSPLDRARQRHDPYAVLRLPGYRRLLFTLVSASIGAEMRDLAIHWELYERTASYLVLGYIGLVQVIPVIVLAIPAGHLADNLSRSRVVVGTEIAMAIVSVALALLSFTNGPLWLIFFCLFLHGIANAVSRPARWALVPQIVPTAVLTNAVTWNSSAWQIASILGPAAAGRLIDVSKVAGWVYLLDAGFAALAAVSLSPVDTPPARSKREPLSFDTLVAGFRFVKRSRLITAAITLDLFAVLLGGAVTLLPVFAKDILRLSPTGLGWLRAATPMGALAMSLVLNQRTPMRRAGRSLLLAVAGFGLATIVFGISTDPILSFAMLFLTGAFDNVSVVVRATLVQVLTPDTMRGRVSAVNGIFIGASNELGGFESGLAAKLLGPVVSVVAGGVGSILVVIAAAFAWPEVRRLGSLSHLRPEEDPSAN